MTLFRMWFYGGFYIALTRCCSWAKMPLPIIATPIDIVSCRFAGIEIVVDDVYENCPSSRLSESGGVLHPKYRFWCSSPVCPFPHLSGPSSAAATQNKKL